MKMGDTVWRYGGDLPPETRSPIRQGHRRSKRKVKLEVIVGKNCDLC